MQQPPLLPFVPQAFWATGPEHHRDADVAEAFGEVDGLVGAALNGRELVQDQHLRPPAGPATTRWCRAAGLTVHSSLDSPSHLLPILPGGS
jgi:hypothetical protein